MELRIPISKGEYQELKLNMERVNKRLDKLNKAREKYRESMRMMQTSWLAIQRRWVLEDAEERKDIVFPSSMNITVDILEVQCDVRPKITDPEDRGSEISGTVESETNERSA